MMLADFNISLIASGLFWLFVFLVMFKTIRGKGHGTVSANASATAAATGGNADVGGVAIHIHAGIMSQNGVELPTIAGVKAGEYVLSGDDPAVKELVSRALEVHDTANLELPSGAIRSEYASGTVEFT